MRSVLLQTIASTIWWSTLFGDAELARPACRKAKPMADAAH